MPNSFQKPSPEIARLYPTRMGSRPLRPDQIRALKESAPPIWIFNVGFLAHSKDIHGIGRIVVHPKPDDKPYFFLRLSRNEICGSDAGENRIDYIVHTPKELAEDFAGISGHLPPEWGLDKRQSGVFLSERPPSADAEFPDIEPLSANELAKIIKEAETQLGAYCYRMIRQADTYWSNPQFRFLITDLPYRAAAIWLEKRGQVLVKDMPWVGKSVEGGEGMVECEFCAAPIQKKAKKCRYCQETQSWAVKKAKTGQTEVAGA